MRTLKPINEITPTALSSTTANNAKVSDATFVGDSTLIYNKASNNNLHNTVPSSTFPVFDVNANTNTSSASSSSSASVTVTGKLAATASDDFPYPVKVLYPVENIAQILHWHSSVHLSSSSSSSSSSASASSGGAGFTIGPGFFNLGNTCYLNSVLQMLMYSPPLMNYVLASASGVSATNIKMDNNTHIDKNNDSNNTRMGKEHINHCLNCPLQKQNKFCLLCQLKQLAMTVHRGKKSEISPKNIVQNLRLISKRFRVGRQEDAHEFLRFVIDNMQKSVISSSFPNATSSSALDNSKPLSKMNAQEKMQREALLKRIASDERVKETSEIHSMFGGYLRSQVKCIKCGHESNKYDSFLDLSLEVYKQSPKLNTGTFITNS
jgi:uncharacterized UBP type Zn finger protein